MAFIGAVKKILKSNVRPCCTGVTKFCTRLEKMASVGQKGWQGASGDKKKEQQAGPNLYRTCLAIDIVMGGLKLWCNCSTGLPSIFLIENMHLAQKSNLISAWHMYA